jgi:hypothetical protein
MASSRAGSEEKLNIPKHAKKSFAEEFVISFTAHIIGRVNL